MSKVLMFLMSFCVCCLVVADGNIERSMELRGDGEYAKASALLKKYSTVATFDTLSASDKVVFLRGVLELAHIKALQDDVTGALTLLNSTKSIVNLSCHSL